MPPHSMIPQHPLGEEMSLRSLRFVMILTMVCLAVAARVANADDAPQTIAIAEVKRDTPVDFAKEVQPLFKKHCVACHNSTTHEGGLNLESPEAMLKGGDSGPGFVAGKGVESLLLDRATGKSEPLMPPAGNKANADTLVERRTRPDQAVDRSRSHGHGLGGRDRSTGSRCPAA